MDWNTQMVFHTIAAKQNLQSFEYTAFKSNEDLNFVLKDLERIERIFQIQLPVIKTTFNQTKETCASSHNYAYFFGETMVQQFSDAHWHTPDHSKVDIRNAHVVTEIGEAFLSYHPLEYIISRIYGYELSFKDAFLEQRTLRQNLKQVTRTKKET